MVLKFKNRNAYLKWLAFKHIHLGKSKSEQKVLISGREHKVCHTDVCRANKLKASKK